MEKIRILLADDNALVRDELPALLNMQEDLAVVGTAIDGQEALKRASELSPQVVLMDVTMPRMTGVEATRRLKKSNPDIEVILFSIYDHEDYVKEGLKVGAAAYVLKGLPTDDLAQVIRRVYHKSGGSEEG